MFSSDYITHCGHMATVTLTIRVTVTAELSRSEEGIMFLF